MVFPFAAFKLRDLGSLASRRLGFRETQSEEREDED
jgi:hypothetical protein